MQLYGPSLVADASFPESPVVGTLVFKDKRVYIAAELVVGVPVWVPLTNEINSYVYNESAGSTSWTVTHNLNTGSPLVQIYDEDNAIIIPDSITPSDNNTLVVGFSASQTGLAVIMAGNSEQGTDRSSLSYQYEQEFTSATTVVVTHNLGYNPILRVFLGTTEVQPTSIIHDSIMQATITFAGSSTGTVRAV